MVMPNEHAPLVLRDHDLVSWQQNVINLAGVPVQYGYGCLDGMVNTLKVVGDSVFLVAVDAGAHFARHIYNSARSVLFSTEEESGTLERAVDAGRSYDFSYPLVVEMKKGLLDLRTYYELYLKLMFENMQLGFVHGNYVRPFYCPSDQRKDGDPSDPQINGRAYEKTFSIMMLHWPNLLGPRSPTFPGLNILLARSSRSPYPGTSLIEFKAESSYAPTRGPAVEEKNRFNDRFGDKLTVHDILLLDHSGKHLREASGSNLFFIDNKGTIITPSLDGSIFPGITRNFVIDLANRLEAEGFDYSFHNSYHHDAYIGLDQIRLLSKFAGEMFLTGSALGVIPVKRLVIPKKDNPETLADYEVLDFKTGPDTRTALIQDCYSCVSVGDAFEVSANGKRVRIDEFASWPLLLEVPAPLGDKAKQLLMPSGLDKPLDQTLRTGRVIPMASERTRIVTME